MADITPTKGAALALAEERDFLQIGYGFLDEKRMLLAATLLKELAAWTALRDNYADQMAKSVAAMKLGLARHGFERLQRYPVADAPCDVPPMRLNPFLGIGLFDAPELTWPVTPVHDGVDLSQSAEDFRAAFAGLVPLALGIAARQSNILRLLREYRKTERRTRALETVLLPETKSQLATITEYLDEADQEEAIRIRNAAR